MKIMCTWTQNEHKIKHRGSALQFFSRYSEGVDDFLSRIVTGHETWVSYVTPESKRQTMEWRHTTSLSTKKSKQTLIIGKNTSTVFCDRQGVLLLDLLPRGQTINAKAYYVTLIKLCRVQYKISGEACLVAVLLSFTTMPAHTQRMWRNNF